MEPVKMHKQMEGPPQALMDANRFLRPLSNGETLMIAGA
jgi:hypothetical protein